MSYMNVSDIKSANKSAGRFWFSPATVRAFQSRVVSRIYDAGVSDDYPQGSRLWIESTRNDSGREYMIARFNVESHDISYVHEDYTTLRFGSKDAAVEVLEGLL